MTPQTRPDSPEAIGVRLRLIRIAFGKAQKIVEDELSQAEFGRRMGVPPNTLNNCETGDNRIGIDNALKISAKTGVSLDYIYKGTGELPHTLAIEIEKLERAEQRAEAKRA